MHPWTYGPVDLLTHPKPIHRRRVVPLPGAEHGGGELRLVRRVGEVLRLETERRALFVDLAALARDLSVQEIARVELDAGLGGEHVHRAPARGIDDVRRGTQCA